MNTTTTAIATATPFLQDMGARVIEARDGKAQVSLEIAARHLNGWKSAHGGVLMALLDAAMSAAGRSLYEEPRAGVTVEMTTTFVQPCGGEGTTAIASATAYHRSTTLCFCEAELRCEGQLIAKAMGTFKFLRSEGIDRLARQSTQAQ